MSLQTDWSSFISEDIPALLSVDTQRLEGTCGTGRKEEDLRRRTNHWHCTWPLCMKGKLVFDHRVFYFHNFTTTVLPFTSVLSFFLRIQYIGLQLHLQINNCQGLITVTDNCVAHREFISKSDLMTICCWSEELCREPTGALIQRKVTRLMPWRVKPHAHTYTHKHMHAHTNVTQCAILKVAE